MPQHSKPHAAIHEQWQESTINGTILALAIIFSLSNVYLGIMFLGILLAMRMADLGVGISLLLALGVPLLIFASGIGMMPDLSEVFVNFSLIGAAIDFHYQLSDFNSAVKSGETLLEINDQGLSEAFSVASSFSGNFITHIFTYPFQIFDAEAWAFVIGLPSLSAGFLSSKYAQLDKDPHRQQAKRMKREKEGKDHVPKFPKRWLNRVASKDVAKDGGFLIGVDEAGKDVVLPKSNLRQHILVSGTTGSGKTTMMCNFIEGAVAKDWPVIILDGKGDLELGAQCSQFAEDNGMPSYHFTMMNDCDLAYNPFVAGDFTSKKDRIVQLYDEQNEYYRNIAELYLQAAIEIMEACDLDIDLMTISRYIYKDHLANLLRGAVKEGTLGKERADELMDKLERQKAAQEQIDSIAVNINNLAWSSIGPFFDTADEERRKFSLPGVLEEKALVYISLPTSLDSSLVSRLAKLVINDMKATMYQHYKHEGADPFLLVLDEFGAFAGPQVKELLTQGRSLGANCVLGAQSFIDLQGAHESERLQEQIKNNVNTHIVHRLGPEDREAASRIFGTKDSQTMTAQIDSTDPTFRGTITDDQEFVYHPTQVKNLRGGGECLLWTDDATGQHYAKRLWGRMSKIQQRQGQ